jgi:hypothetical protein
VSRHGQIFKILTAGLLAGLVHTPANAARVSFTGEGNFSNVTNCSGGSPGSRPDRARRKQFKSRPLIRGGFCLSASLTSYLAAIAAINSAQAVVDDTVRTWFHQVQSV